VIRITDEPIVTIVDIEELPVGEIGELIVCGPQVSPEYVTRVDANAGAKIIDERAGASSPPCASETNVGGEDASPRRVPSNPARLWHRTGDVGYFDEHDRFWYCGRKSQRVETALGPLYTECVEAIFNAQPLVRRSALIGIGARGQQTSVIIIERRGRASLLPKHILDIAKSSIVSRRIENVLFYYPKLPVDVRHNAKINREKLAEWAGKRLTMHFDQPPAP
jgi:acyl-CoA synthetase (AMP-forming)/AMP-acid ligase II